MIRALLTRLLEDLLEERLNEARTEGRRDAETLRPKVGVWCHQDGDSHAIFDDRGHEVAWVGPPLSNDDARRWWGARRPGQVCDRGLSVGLAAAQACALEVLESWADVSAAREQASG